jgi:tetratricopeptide (TPR) repeat protein
MLDPNPGADSTHFRRNPAAYEPYLQAQYFLARGEDKDDLEKALGYVDQAIQLDPDFAPSWALRSLVIYTAATIGLRDHEKSFLEARDNAEKAIALDARSAAGYLALGWVKLGFEWDWDGADAALKRQPTFSLEVPSSLAIAPIYMNASAAWMRPSRSPRKRVFSTLCAPMLISDHCC